MSALDTRLGTSLTGRLEVTKETRGQYAHKQRQKSVLIEIELTIIILILTCGDGTRCSVTALVPVDD